MAEPLWTIGEIVKATGGTCLGAHATPVTGLSIDSRSLAPRRVLRRHSRAKPRRPQLRRRRASAEGAACAIVDRSFPSGDEERLVRVADTLEALECSRRAPRARARPTRW